MKSRPDQEPPANGLAPEDRRLWQEISATLRPLKRHGAAKPTPVEIAKPVKPAPAARQPAGKQPAAALPKPASLLPERAARPPQIDDKTARSLRRGRTAIDARIDLHGLTEGQAHEALLHFLSACAGRRQFLVLVITGKGERSGGLLRQRVPRWFAEPAFRNLVSAWRPAGPAHGGEGALYVRLRNPARLRGGIS